MLHGIGDTVTLANGIEMPRLGLGTYKSAEGGDVESAVAYALEIGYRGIDTASIYDNEAGIGRALAASGVPRNKIFLASKMWNDEQGHDATLSAFERSLAMLQTDYLDLYLVHWPRPETPETWRAMERLLAEVIEGEGDKQKIAAKAVKARLKEIGKDPLYADERAALEAYADLLEQQTEAKAKRKAAQDDLDKKIDAKYPKLTEAEIKALVVDDKWMARLSAAVQGELDRVSQTLTGRIRELAERYATPLPKLTGEVGTLAARVDEHLKKMGASWK